MIYPDFLEKGDSIGICAPSAGVGHKLGSFDASLETLQSLNVSIKEAGRVRVDSLRPDTACGRGRAFNSLVEDASVKTIISASGGEYCFDVLPFIDTETFCRNPKWFCGASDPTSILYYLTTKCDVATIYGFNAGSFDWEPLHDFQRNAMSILSGDIVTQQSFEKYDDCRDFSQSGAELTGDVYWELYNCENNALDVEGRMIGGCSDVLENIFGTPYDGTSEFLAKYKDDGFIWYLDPFETNPIAFHRFILKMKYMEYLDGAKAVVIGRIMFPGDYSSSDYVELLKEDLDCPFVFNADIGHVKPCMTIINGSVGRIKCENGKASLDMKME
ncbi:MAG: LD-carboxypeptidase [Mogibacterium sp.]|nr:LD-carboxypeptidase [Mogibacterium sp.]